MNPYLMWAKIGLALAVVAAVFLAGIYVTQGHYKAVIADMEAQWAKDNQAAAQMQVEMVSARAQLQHESEIRHAQDQLVIDDYRNRLADSVRVHIPTGCAAGQAAAPGADRDRAAGVFSARVDAAFARLQSGIDRLAARCDQLNIDAIMLNGELGK